MIFVVGLQNPDHVEVDEFVYTGPSWPMARAALDSLVLKGVGRPFLDVIPETEPEA